MVYATTKSQIGCTVTMQLVSNFIFDTQTLQALIALSPEFQASNHLLILNGLVGVGPGRKHKHKKEFSRDHCFNNQNKFLLPGMKGATLTNKPCHKVGCKQKTKLQIGYMVTMQLISNYVFDKQIHRSLIVFNSEFQASKHLFDIEQPGLCLTWS